MASLMFGMTLANSVVEEKQSRIVEIIATAIPVRQLLAGKVLGNTVLAVGQMALYVGVGLVGLAFTDYRGAGPAVVRRSVGWFLVFFLAGFVALACLWAVAGALASRTEDLQSTTTPLHHGPDGRDVRRACSSRAPSQVVGSYVPPRLRDPMPHRLLERDAAVVGADLAVRCW